MQHNYSTGQVRLKNVVHVRPIVYGSYAQPLKANEPRNDASHTHKWAVFVKGHNGEDLSSFVKKVTFKLHESFQNAERTIDAPPYVVEETGWGEFEIPIKIFFHDTKEKPVQFFLMLQLHPKDEKDDGTPESEKTVIAEYYDELIFSEPSEEMDALLRANPPVAEAPNPPPKIDNFDGVATTFDAGFEARELAKLDRALAAIGRQIQEARDSVRSLDSEYQELKHAA